MIPTSFNFINNKKVNKYSEKNDKEVYYETSSESMEDEKTETQSEPDYDDLNLIRLRESVDILYNECFLKDTKKEAKKDEIKTENSYLYEGLNSLKKIFIDNKSNVVKNNQRIHICAYQVNTETDIPFLQFFLSNYVHILSKKSNCKGDKLVFPSFKYDETIMTSENIIDLCYDVLGIYYLCYDNCMNKNNGNEHRHYGIYKGYEIMNDNIYIFFDCSIYNISSHYLYKNNDLKLVLIDEIVNKKYVCNDEIHESVYDLFYANPSLFTLSSRETGNPFPIPLCAYSANFNYKIEFSLIFSQTQNENFNNYYVFTDYANALEKCKQIKKKKDKETNKSIKIGIIRYAVFSENLKILNKNEYDNFASKDFNGESYYYCYNSKPYWIIKEHNKHQPLSAHYVKVVEESVFHV
jgi:hypothetical protein